MCLPPKADKYREFLDRKKSVTDNIVNNFEYFKHGNTEESIRVPNCKKFEGWYVQEAMSACVAVAATALVEPVATSVTG